MSDEQKLDKKKIHKMTYKILKAEDENLKTREKTMDQMVEEIRKIITSEADKNF
jgi:hypothetical protein